MKNIVVTSNPICADLNVINPEIESWGCNAVCTYVYKLQKMIKEFARNEETIASKMETLKNNFVYMRNPVTDNTTYIYPNNAFKEFPVEVLIDNFNYEPVMSVKRPIVYHHCPRRKTCKTVNRALVGEFIINGVNHGDFTLDFLAREWRNIDIVKNKKKFLNYGNVLKNINYREMWSKYDPNDNSIFEGARTKPANFIYYQIEGSIFNTYLSYTNRTFLSDYFNNSPECIKKVNRFIDKNTDKFYQYQPTLESAVKELETDIIHSANYDGSVFKYGRLFEEYEDEPMYANQSNYRSGALDSSMIRIVSNTLHELYPSRDERFKAYSHDNIKVIVTDKGIGETSHSSVISSSFWTYYTHNFEVTVEVNGVAVLTKTFENVTTGSSYYSGGW